MNKYLEKIAGLEPVRKDVTMGKVKEKPPITAPGSKLTHGAKTLFSRALLKAAQVKVQAGEPPSNWKHDVVSTGLIGASGAATGGLAYKIQNWNKPKVKGEGWKAMALTGGLGLIGDYAAVKLDKKVKQYV